MATARSNIMLMVGIEGEDKVEGVIHTFLAPLIHELAIKYPQWVFRARKWGPGLSSLVILVITEFDVLDKREVIGVIGRENRYSRFSGDVYVIKTDKIGDVRERGDSIKTANMKRAVATVKKFVSAKGLKERYEENYVKAREKLGEVRAVKAKVLYVADAPILGMYTKFVNSRMEELRASLTVHEREQLDARDIAKREFDLCNEVVIGAGATGAVFVHIHGEDYLLGTERDNPTCQSSEQLPPHIRTAVGMLKLLQPSQLIEGVGMKVSEDAFIVTRKADE